MRSVKESFRRDSVRVFRLDKDGLMKRLRECAANILRTRPDVIEISLFGSLARGDASPGSDADLLVTLDSSSIPFQDRPGNLISYFRKLGTGCDLHVYTTAELNQLLTEGNSFIRTAASEKIVLASRQ
jgi:predicted nucleotidyltransferase